MPASYVELMTIYAVLSQRLNQLPEILYSRKLREKTVADGTFLEETYTMVLFFREINPFTFRGRLPTFKRQ